MPKPITLTPEIVAAHERLYPRLAALLKQIERVAGRRVGAEVPGETVALARRLCDEARKLLGREGRGIVLAKNPDATGLALALGQAVAALEAFEAEHSGVDRSGVVVWRLADGTTAPVARLRSARRPPAAAAAPAAKPDFGHMGKTAGEARWKLIRRIVERENIAYASGYRDAQEGKPPREPIKEW